MVLARAVNAAAELLAPLRRGSVAESLLKSMIGALGLDGGAQAVAFIQHLSCLGTPEDFARLLGMVRGTGTPTEGETGKQDKEHGWWRKKKRYAQNRVRLAEELTRMSQDASRPNETRALAMGLLNTCIKSFPEVQLLYPPGLEEHLPSVDWTASVNLFRRGLSMASDESLVRALPAPVYTTERSDDEPAPGEGDAIRSEGP